VAREKRRLDAAHDRIPAVQKEKFHDDILHTGARWKSPTQPRAIYNPARRRPSRSYNLDPETRLWLYRPRATSLPDVPRTRFAAGSASPD
jgi:hypothetical protein